MTTAERWKDGEGAAAGQPGSSLPRRQASPGPGGCHAPGPDLLRGPACRQGHTIDVRLSHQDLAELVGAARPVVGAELVQMRREGLVEYTRCYFCVDDLDGLDRVAAG